MIIGILSDTHDRVDAMAAGLQASYATAAPNSTSIAATSARSAASTFSPAHRCAFVFGNTDFDRVGLARYAASIDVPCYGNFADLTQDGKRIAVIHGDDSKLKQRLLSAQEHDYFLQGHTHIRADQKIGKTRLINPGAPPRPAKTVATLDTATDQLKYLIIQSSSGD